MSVHTSRRPSRVEQGWVRCPRCRQHFKHEHRCTVALGELVTTRPYDFEAQVEEARAEARADAAAGEQLALDALVTPCASCGGTECPLDEQTGTCTDCMAAAARDIAGLPPRSGPP
jgi:hypothetical protein